MASRLIILILFCMNVLESDILWDYPMDNAIPSEWSTTTPADIIVYSGNNCPGYDMYGRDYCWMIENGGKLIREAIITTNYYNLKLTYSVETRDITSSDHCYLYYTVDGDTTNYLEIYHWKKGDEDEAVDVEYNSWNNSIVDNNNLGIRIAIISPDDTPHDCYFNEMRLEGDYIPQQTTISPTTKPPTDQPATTGIPTTNFPTRSPTNQPTSKNPTISPTTTSPTKVPTYQPTKSPTDQPITTSPSMTPTTAQPTSKKPTTSPITLRPIETKPTSEQFLVVDNDAPSTVPSIIDGNTMSPTKSPENVNENVSKSPQNNSFFQHTIFYIIVGCAGIILIIFFVAICIKKRKKRKKPVEKIKSVESAGTTITTTTPNYQTVVMSASPMSTVSMHSMHNITPNMPSIQLANNNCSAPDLDLEGDDDDDIDGMYTNHVTKGNDGDEDEDDVVTKGMDNETINDKQYKTPNSDIATSDDY